LKETKFNAMKSILVLKRKYSSTRKTVAKVNIIYYEYQNKNTI